jgi:glycosyltransferase involved in cell wall biosynthesis
MRILFISHQLDFSGAPLALLQLARTAMALGHDAHALALAAGPLGKWFTTAGVRAGDSSPRGASSYDLIVANTVVSVPAALRIAGNPQRVLPWIHESRYFLSVLRVDPAALGLSSLQRAVFPARFQLTEYAEWMGGAERLLLPNGIAMPAEMTAAPASEALICSGHWEKRKGQDRLLHLLEATSTDRRIVFLGAVRPPHVSSPHLSFTGQVAPEQARDVIAASAGLISTSEAEVQPLAVIEAILSKRPVLLSDIPAHRDLLDLMPDLLLFDPMDPASFRHGLNELDRQRGDATLLEGRQKRALECFGLETFSRNASAVFNMYAH